MARDSSAPITSNEGFSVVAPMKVSSPSSTYGRKASCCALLNRCTSSTKRMVGRPDCASTARARATASRISFTPDSTAEMAMNSALQTRASRRASVVLPTPGGPQRIIEWSLPDSIASRSGLPGPSRCDWPTTSSRRCGRNFSASGASGVAWAKRSDILREAGGGRREAGGGDWMGIAFTGSHLHIPSLIPLPSSRHSPITSAP